MVHAKQTLLDAKALHHFPDGQFYLPQETRDT
jgi:hypothetical protein